MFKGGVIMNKWYNNYGLWVSLGALLLMILQDAGLNITPERYNTYVDLILNILVIAGVVSSPKLGKGYKDRK